MRNHFINKSLLHTVFLLAMVIFLVVTRFIGNSYDNLRHLHPDERHLVMVVLKLSFFDELDPDFFAYGSFPLYTLQAIAQSIDSIFSTNFDSYDGLLVLGRNLSSGIDIAIAFVTYLLAYTLSKKRSIALLALFFYSIFFFPIQNSNFFIVDNFVNLFFSLSLLFLLKYIQKPSLKFLSALGVSFGLLLASKITGIILLAPISIYFFLSPWFKNRQKPQSFSHRLLHRLSSIFHMSQSNNSQPMQNSKWKSVLFSIQHFLIFLIVATTTLFITSPYIFLHFPQFKQEILAQMTMNSDAYIFPYTLQYVPTQPYLYYIKQMFLWGIGPFSSIFVGVGLFKILSKAFKKVNFSNIPNFLFGGTGVYLFANLIFFLVLGQSAVKFMRYLLPLYPAMAILSAYGLAFLFGKIGHRALGKVSIALVIFLAISWTLSFVSIYTRPHSRESASVWMLKNIPPQSLLAQEHWDDRLPLYGGERFQYIDLPLYELPDDEQKWAQINQTIQKADYIVMTSNRLYGSLPKLADCKKYKKCYPLTAQYYANLFSEKLGYKKVVEFHSRPSFLGIEIVDDEADESFTVYDHPKVLIYKNVSKR